MARVANGKKNHEETSSLARLPGDFNIFQTHLKDLGQ
jgi:hypothetical protein